MRFSTGRTGEFAMHDAEDDRNENERGHGCQAQPANRGTAERRVLLTAFAQAQCHRHHADERERGHQHRTETHESHLEGGGKRIAVYPSAATATAAAKKAAIPIAMIHRGLRTVSTFASAVPSIAAGRASAVATVETDVARVAELADEAAPGS
jgi:hypothetical protein